MNIEQAKRIPIEDVLKRLGHVPKRHANDQLWYTSPLRQESNPSFKVNRSANLWYDFGEGQGGDVIDLVRRIEHLPNVSETLARMDELIGSVETPPPPKLHLAAKTPAPGVEPVSVGPLKSQSLRAYLKKRGIDPRTVADSVKEVHYRQRDNEYFALGIENASGGYELRNPLFKGTLGRKDITVCPGNADRVAVFEGMFDYLTAVQMAGGPLKDTVIILNSVSLRDRATARISELSPQHVDLYRDNDAAGEQLLAHFRDALPTIEVNDQSAAYQDHSDLNAWHSACCHPR